MKFRQVDEGFEWVFKADGVEAQVARLKQWAENNQTLVSIVRWGVGAQKVDWGLPSGMPDTIKLDEDIPAGMSDTTIQMEWRRINAFSNPNGNMQKLVDWKREANWMQVLEGLHHIEAKWLTAAKDGTLLELCPQLETLLPALGIEEYNVPVKKKQRKKRSTKKSVA